MAARRRLTVAGLAGAGVVGGLAAWAGVNRAAVKLISRRPDPVDPSELALPDDVVERTVTMSDGWELGILERGPANGPVVLLLHGITLAATVWTYQLSALADAGLRVVAVDMRGHGRSGREDSPSITLDRLAADVAEAMEALELERVTVVGHSMGGMVTLRMLGADPGLAKGDGRVAALVLAGTTANATKGRGFPGFSDLIAAAQPLMASASGLAARLPGPTLPAYDLAFLLARVTFGEDSSPRQVYFTGKLTSDVPVRVSAELMLEIVRFDAEDVLGTIQLPTTVVVGDRDLMTPMAQSEYLAEHIAGAELVVFPGCGHMLMLERPDELNRLIVELAGS